MTQSRKESMIMLVYAMSKTSDRQLSLNCKNMYSDEPRFALSGKMNQY